MDPNNEKNLESEVDKYVFKPFRFSLVTNNGDKRKPKPRSGHRLVTDGKGNVYCYGGYNPTVIVSSDSEDEVWNESQPLFREVWKFNFASGRWNKLHIRSIPNELVSCSLVYFNNSLTVFGGTGYPFGAYSSNSVALCNVSDIPLCFDLLDVEGELPSPQYGQGCILDDPFFYTVGGTNGYDYSSDVHRLNLTNGRWELLYKCTGKSNEPFGRYRHELAYDGQRIFLLGGGTVDLNASLEYLPVFYLNSKKWGCMKSNADSEYGYPSPRKYHSCVKLPGELKFLVIGGFDDNEVFNDCWLLDLKDIAWKYLPSMKMPLATYFHGSTVTPTGKLYSFGGVHHRYKNPVRTSFMFSAWLGIPSLKEMCWDACKHYKFTERISKSELRLLGVPVQYINEID